VVAETAFTSLTGARSTSRLTIVDLPEPLGPDKTTMRWGFAPSPASVKVSAPFAAGRMKDEG
jgi:hypothetical protein